MRRTIRPLVAATTIMLMSGGVQAAAAAASPPVPRSEQIVLDDASTDWTKMLSKQVSAVYPLKAYTAKQGGLVRLKCDASETGDLSNCSIESESPADQGFGAAALKLIAYIRLKPHIENGQAVAGTVIVPLDFRPDAVSKPPAAAAPQ